MIAVVTDSASMLPGDWRDRDGVRVAPMTVVVDGEAFRESVDITAADFFARLADGAMVSTAAASPGDVLACYQDAAAAGADAVVSVHTGSDYSAVLEAVGVARSMIALPVEVVDTGTVSFPVALCVAAAASATAQPGAELTTVAEAARSTAAVTDSIFVIGTPELAERSGRLHLNGEVPGAMTLLTLGPKGVGDAGEADDPDDALDRMAAHVVAAVDEAGPLRVGVGDADRPDLGRALADRIGATPGIAELTRYEVGPSVAAHSGAGTVGAVWAPIAQPNFVLDGSTP